MKHRFFTSFALAMLSLPLLVGCKQQQEELPAPAAREASSAATPAEGSTEAPSASAFSPYQAPASVAVGGNCALDAIDGHPAAGSVLSADSDATFGGWAATPQGQVPDANAGAVLILSSSEAAYSVPLVAGGDRPDVAAALNNPALAKSGFNIVTSLDDVKPGDYAVSVGFPGVPAMVCQFNQTVAVK